MKITEFLAEKIFSYRIDDKESEQLWSQKTQLVRHAYLTLLKHIMASSPRARRSGSTHRERAKHQKELFSQIDAALDGDESYYKDTVKSPWPIDHNQHIENFNQFLSPEYRVPENDQKPDDLKSTAALKILSQLNTLYLYYTLAPRYTAEVKRKIPVGLLGSMDVPLEEPRQLASRMDYIAGLLEYHAGLIISFMPEAHRKAALADKKSKDTKVIMQEVISAYYHIDAKEREVLKTVPNRLCKEVARRLITRAKNGTLTLKKVPSKNTIEKYLREEGILQLSNSKI